MLRNDTTAPRRDRRGAVLHAGAVSLAGVLLAVASAATPAADAPRVADLIRKAKIVGPGRVTAAEDLDYGRIRVHTLVLDEELKPGGTEPPRSMRVVSLVDQPGAASVAVDRAGVAMVQPLRRNSYLDQHLTEPGSMYQFVDGRAGWLEAPQADRLTAVVAPVRRMIEQSVRPSGDIAARAQDRRSLVFEMIAAPHPLLAANGIADLSTIPGLAGSLGEEEAAILTTALNAAALPLPLREDLIEQIASLGLRRMIAPLQNVDDPGLQEAAWAALRELGAPVSQDELQRQLSADEPQRRLAAARELLEREGDEAIPTVARTALRDPDEQVRLGAIAALGATGSPAAVPPLEETFGSEEIEERQATARALREIGGDPAAEALHRLAFDGSIDAQRYAVLVLITLEGRDDPRVRDIAKRHSDAQIKDMLEHGLEAGHGH